MAQVWPSKETVTPTTNLLRTVSPHIPFSLPVKVLMGSCHYTQLQKRGHSKSTDTCWNSQFLPWSLVWPSLLLLNPRIYVIIFESLVVKSTSCQAANYSLAQKAEASKRKCTSAQCKLGWIPSPLLPQPPISDVSYSFLKGTPKENAFTLLRLSHRPLGKMTWKPQH